MKRIVFLSVLLLAAMSCSRVTVVKEYDASGLIRVQIDSWASIPWDAKKSLIQEASDKGPDGEVRDVVAFSSEEFSHQASVELAQLLLEALIKLAATGAAVK